MYTAQIHSYVQNYRNGQVNEHYIISCCNIYLNIVMHIMLYASAMIVVYINNYMHVYASHAQQINKHVDINTEVMKLACMNYDICGTSGAKKWHVWSKDSQHRLAHVFNYQCIFYREQVSMNWNWSL